MKRRLSLAAIALGLPVIALIAAEFVARYVYRDVRSSGNARSYFAAREPVARTNHLGFRDGEFGPKNPSRYRIVVVGDSLTWGVGIEDHERFSNRLQQILGPRYEVLNFGHPGSNLPEHLEVLELALTVAPDFVLLQLYPNDFEMPDMRRPQPYHLVPWRGLNQRLIESFIVYNMLAGEWEAIQEAVGISESYPRYMRRELGDPSSPHALRAFPMLRRFIERARGAGVPAGIVFFPWPTGLGPSYQLGFLHDRVAAICADEHIRCLDLRADYASGFRTAQSIWVSRWDSHPNARANRRAADEIVATFASHWYD